LACGSTSVFLHQSSVKCWKLKPRVSLRWECCANGMNDAGRQDDANMLPNVAPAPADEMAICCISISPTDNKTGPNML